MIDFNKLVEGETLAVTSQEIIEHLQQCSNSPFTCSAKVLSFHLYGKRKKAIMVEFLLIDPQDLP